MLFYFVVRYLQQQQKKYDYVFTCLGKNAAFVARRIEHRAQEFLRARGYKESGFLYLQAVHAFSKTLKPHWSIRNTKAKLWNVRQSSRPFKDVVLSVFQRHGKHSFYHEENPQSTDNDDSSEVKRTYRFRVNSFYRKKRCTPLTSIYLEDTVDLADTSTLQLSKVPSSTASPDCCVLNTVNIITQRITQARRVQNSRARGLLRTWRISHQDLVKCLQTMSKHQSTSFELRPQSHRAYDSILTPYTKVHFLFRGRTSMIFLANDPASNTPIILKAAFTRKQLPFVKHEYDMVQSLIQSDGYLTRLITPIIPNSLQNEGVCPSLPCFFAMKRCYPLDLLFTTSSNYLPVPLAVQLAFIGTLVLKSLFKHQVLHCNIAPRHIMWHSMATTPVAFRLCNFSAAVPYQPHHVPKHNPLISVSRRVQMGCTFDYIDDAESLVWTVIALVLGQRLPWHDCHDYDIVMDEKEAFAKHGMPALPMKLRDWANYILSRNDPSENEAYALTDKDYASLLKCLLDGNDTTTPLASKRDLPQTMDAAHHQGNLNARKRQCIH